MTKKPSKQFYVDTPLMPGGLTLPRALARRLHRVLRMKPGQEIALFNSRDGLWQAQLDTPADGRTTVIKQIREQPDSRNLHLFLALAKRDAFDRAVRQATELGVSHIHPVQTAFSVPDKLNTERLKNTILEAAEQCERLTLPVLNSAAPLKEAVTAFGAPLYWADEGPKNEAYTGWNSSHEGEIGEGALIGPEGGFSPEERTWLHGQQGVIPVGLGHNILRVDTAVCAALTLVNANRRR